MTYDFMAAKFGKKVLGLDADYNVVIAHKQLRREVILGDVTDSGFWENLEQGNITLVILTITNHSVNRFAVTRLKQSHFGGKIAAVGHYEDEIKELRELGANSVFNLYEEAGTGFAEHVCKVMKGDGKFNKS